MPNMDGVSDIKMPLGIQKLGAPAASTAATSPTQGPATARPSRPTQRTTPAPRMAMVRRWEVTPSCSPKSQKEGASRSEVTGGWAALGAVLKGARKNWCSESPSPVKPYQKAS
jgi:hypothetical protein